MLVLALPCFFLLEQIDWIIQKTMNVFSCHELFDYWYLRSSFLQKIFRYRFYDNQYCQHEKQIFELCNKLGLQSQEHKVSLEESETLTIHKIYKDNIQQKSSTILVFSGAGQDCEYYLLYSSSNLLQQLVLNGYQVWLIHSRQSKYFSCSYTTSKLNLPTIAENQYQEDSIRAIQLVHRLTPISQRNYILLGFSTCYFIMKSLPHHLTSYNIEYIISLSPWAQIEFVNKSLLQQIYYDLLIYSLFNPISYIQILHRFSYLLQPRIYFKFISLVLSWIHGISIGTLTTNDMLSSNMNNFFSSFNISLFLYQYYQSIFFPKYYLLYEIDKPIDSFTKIPSLWFIGQKDRLSNSLLKKNLSDKYPLMELHSLPNNSNHFDCFLNNEISSYINNIIIHRINNND